MNTPLSQWFLCLYILAGIATPLAAQTSGASFLAGEKQIRAHDRQLTLMAENLEDWLAGRKKLTDLNSVLNRVAAELGPYRTLAPEVGREVLQREHEMVAQVKNFSAKQEPDSEGQRALFLSLSELAEDRTLKLLNWRREQLHRLLALPSSREIHAYYRWEASWIPIWVEEAELTRKLQTSFLDQKADSSKKKPILQSLLKLRLRAESTACPEQYRTLDTKSKERLTLLARTAEQLLRLEEQKSSGALARVRRLSRQLNDLTEEFQAERLTTLQRINP